MYNAHLLIQKSGTATRLVCCVLSCAAGRYGLQIESLIFFYTKLDLRV